MTKDEINHIILRQDLLNILDSKDYQIKDVLLENDVHGANTQTITILLRLMPDEINKANE